MQLFFCKSVFSKPVLSIPHVIYFITPFPPTQHLQAGSFLCFVRWKSIFVNMILWEKISFFVDFGKQACYNDKK